MKKLVFCMSFLIILPINETAIATLTCPLQNPTTSVFLTDGLINYSRGWRFRVNEPCIFVGQLGVNSLIGSQASHRQTFFDFDIPAIFDQGKTISGFGWTVEDLSAPVPFVEESDDNFFAFFSHPVGYSNGHRNSIGNPWFPTHAIEWLETKYVKNGDPLELPASIFTNYQGGIPDIEYDVIDVVPTPGAIILGGVGIGMIGWLRRRRTL